MPTRDGQASTRAAREAWKKLCRERRAERRKAERATARAERDARREAVAQAGLHQALGRPRTKHRPQPAKWTYYSPDVPRKAYHAILLGDTRADAISLAVMFGVHVNTISNWRRQHPQLERAIERAIAARSALRLIGRLGISARLRLDPEKTNPNAKSWRGFVRSGKAV